MLALTMFTAFPLIAQEEEEGEKEGEKFGAALVLGYTHIPEARSEGETTESENLPTIGFDLFYYPGERWKLGLVVDLELNKYELDFEGERLVRENALVTGLVAGYELFPRFGLIFGPGVEFERNKNLFILRFGIEYAFLLGNSWELFPAINYDFKKDFNTYSLGIGIGKRF
ncbi:MAG: hypothetical protein ABF293_13150 [Flavobacteriaceae bacterium]